jgi:hypothetical protein
MMAGGGGVGQVDGDSIASTPLHFLSHKMACFSESQGEFIFWFLPSVIWSRFPKCP